MTVYDGRNRIGEIEDWGPHRILAFGLNPDGDRIPLGTFPDRRSAINAVSSRHAAAAIGRREHGDGSP